MVCPFHNLTAVWKCVRLFVLQTNWNGIFTKQQRRVFQLPRTLISSVIVNIIAIKPRVVNYEMSLFTVLNTRFSRAFIVKQLRHIYVLTATTI